MAEISEELRRRFDTPADKPGHREAVVVTLHADANTDALRRAGLEIVYAMRNRPIVTGTVDAAGLAALAELETVARIEPDGEMHALDS